jgi:hypothetical protein
LGKFLFFNRSSGQLACKYFFMVLNDKIS